VGEGLAAAGLGALLTLLAPLLLDAGMFGAGGVPTPPVALVVDGVPSADVPVSVLVLLGALVAFATVLRAILDYGLIRWAGANRAALVMFPMPGFAVRDGAAPGRRRGDVGGGLDLAAEAGRPTASGAVSTASPRPGRPAGSRGSTATMPRDPRRGRVRPAVA
jgi:hypothetical protein